MQINRCQNFQEQVFYGTLRVVTSPILQFCFFASLCFNKISPNAAVHRCSTTYSTVPNNIPPANNISTGYQFSDFFVGRTPRPPPPLLSYVFHIEMMTLWKVILVLPYYKEFCGTPIISDRWYYQITGCYFWPKTFSRPQPPPPPPPPYLDPPFIDI